MTLRPVNRMCFRGSVSLLVAGTQMVCAPAAISRADPKRGPLELDRVPEWSQGMVWYQVFPERFRNGNADNDPSGWHQTLLPWMQPFDEVNQTEIERHWNRRTVEPGWYSNDPARPGGALAQLVYTRRFGGDLQGVVEQLDEIVALGATGLYLCPVFDARSLHKYDAADHRHIDPTLGSPDEASWPDRSDEDPLDETSWVWEPGDRYFVDVLLPEARIRGLRVIIDGVWNHVGRDHFAFRDVLENGQWSRYADWFKVEFDDEGRVLRYDAWDRPNGSLPEFRQTVEGDLAPGPKAHVFAVTRRWMDPNGDGDPSDGVDGWRLDVAPEVGRAFWSDWRALVRTINPEAYLVGEIWTDAQLWFDGIAFDAQMNYPLTAVIADFFSFRRDDMTAWQASQAITAVLRHRPDHELAQMNLIASHDTERGASMMQNDFERGYDQGAQPWGNDGYDAGPAGMDAKRRLLAVYALLVALPGSPMIYNGDEFALPGADDPDNRRPIPWPDLGAGADEPDTGFRDALAMLLAWRSAPMIGEVFRQGSFEVVPGANQHTLTVRRVRGDIMVEISVSRSGQVRLGPAPPKWASASVMERPFRASAAMPGSIVLRVLTGPQDDQQPDSAP